jgi:hypothetical protein
MWIDLRSVSWVVKGGGVALAGGRSLISVHSGRKER